MQSKNKLNKSKYLKRKKLVFFLNFDSDSNFMTPYSKSGLSSFLIKKTKELAIDSNRSGNRSTIHEGRDVSYTKF